MSCLRLEPCCLFRNCCFGTGALFRNKRNIPTFIQPITLKLIVLNRKIRPHLHTDQTPSATEMQRQPVAMIFFFCLGSGHVTGAGNGVCRHGNVPPVKKNSPPTGRNESRRASPLPLFPLSTLFVFVCASR